MQHRGEPDPLERYRSKRDFAVTPEPSARRAAQGRSAGLRFVVQKHAARRLHYDFRLEWAGTLKSWAVPKGPSLDPGVKRMAVEVEDHPLSYAGFEGTIPEGQYGAGSVIVWDSGTWRAQGDAALGLREGKLEFELHGHKLRGRWVLLRLREQVRGRGTRTNWLLIKARDEAARPEWDYSVTDAEPGSVLQPAGEARAPAATEATSTGAPARRAVLPAALAPQLATRVSGPPQGEGWGYELKFDGYRLLTRMDAGGPRLFTRNGHDWTTKLPGLAQELGMLGFSQAWLDGELVALDDQGRPSFQRLQNAFDRGRSSGPAQQTLVYYLFDLPFDAGQDLRSWPLQHRRDRLQARLRERVGGTAGVLRFSESFSRDAAQLLSAACELRLEGLIGKRLDAPYTSGRSTSWIKLKCGERQEFVIGGYTEPRGSRTGLGALLLGLHDSGGRLRYAGRVGTGFDEAGLRRLAHALSTLRIKSPPFTAVPAAARAGVHWVRPELVAEVSFAQWTHDGLVRQAVFHGLREDKPAQAIGRERAQPAPAPASHPVLPRVTHPERVVDRDSGVTKLELVSYHAAAAGRLLQHLRGRPVALLRAPDGVGGATFFQKHARDAAVLPGLKRLDPTLDPGHDPLLEIDSAAALLECAQMNVVEFHTWNASTRAIDKPDRLVFDLDPGEGVAWARVQEAATLLRVLLQELQLEPLLKTSGGKGLHLVVPIARRWGWDTVKALAHAVVLHLADTLPAQFVAKSGPRNRVGRIFVDYLRNGRGATTVAAWSVRARPGLGVSVPVAWEELASLRSGAHWTLRDAPRRLTQPDPWGADALRGQSLQVALKQLRVPPR